MSLKGLGISDKILKFILVKEMMWYTGKSSLVASLVQWDIEIFLYNLIS